MDLEEELEDLAITDRRRIEHELDRFGVRPVVAVGGIRHVAAGVADAGRTFDMPTLQSKFQPLLEKGKHSRSNTIRQIMQQRRELQSPGLGGLMKGIV